MALKPITQAFTGTDLLSDIPDLLLIGTSAQQAFAGLPPVATRKAVDWGTALGFAPGGLAMAILTDYDLAHGKPITADEVATILGLSPTGVLQNVLTFGKKLAAQIAAPATPTTPAAGA